MTDAQEAQLSEKLEDLRLADDLFPDYATVLGNPDEKDQLIIKYLTLLDQYNQAVDQLNHEFKEGFIDLSRANYANTSSVKPFGRDCWDDTVKAIKKVRVGEDYKLIDFDRDETKDEDKDKLKDGLEIRNRVKSKGQENIENKEIKKKKKYNPINMFGVLVPLQLRESQAHFNRALPQMITIVNLRKELLSLESQMRPEASGSMN